MLLLKSHLNKPLPPGSLDIICKELAEVQSRTKFLKFWNRILIGVIGAVVFYGLGEIYRLAQPIIIPPVAIAKQDKLVLPLGNFENMERKPIFRNFFEPFIFPEEQARQTSNIIQKFKAQYRVVGVVILGDEPQVILENLKEPETIYAKERQKIGEAMLQEIKEQEIILNVSGQIFALNL